MEGKRIVLGVTGGIAAYKAADLCSRLSKLGAQVQVIMTESATRFISPMTFQTLSRNDVLVDVFDERNPNVVAHVAIADNADLLVVAPATANVIAKMASGLADDMLTTVFLATRAPVLVAPAMNVHMYRHWTVQENIRRLKAHGVEFIDPVEGLLACGYEGQGKLADPADIVAKIQTMLAKKRDWSGRTVLVTAGPTREPLDPVRFFSNRSSGKMGYAIAAAAQRRGARVLLVTGPTSMRPPAGVDVTAVETAEQMYEAVMARLPEADVVIKAAAVADYTPVQVAEQKIKKTMDEINVRLRRTPDILAEIGRRRRPEQCIVGFAAETEQIEQYAREKLLRKGADFIVANDVSQSDIGFDVDNNRVAVYGKDGLVAAWPTMSKQEVADKLLDLVMHHLMKKGQT
ncbi:MAG: phosphopantothenoylcysteine decarboxylase [Bacillaceae bacterium G1]|nr:bifunctional phosphopantothenoylcysteine decarboxylase/phosphopantothenate--cysteine ligase CoaBC [Bacillota bacterium]OJF17447.1 MAG: phosphopantothenoylcysteine decarboxylase [Bacillaceae bacterium G1]